MLHDVLDKLKAFLYKSPRIHLRACRISTLSDLLDLLDRFEYGPMKYPLEWDDFISWKHENRYIDGIRETLESNEALLVSKNPSDRQAFFEILRRERNKVAAVMGLPEKGVIAH